MRAIAHLTAFASVSLLLSCGALRGSSAEPSDEGSWVPVSGRDRVYEMNEMDCARRTSTGRCDTFEIKRKREEFNPGTKYRIELKAYFKATFAGYISASNDLFSSLQKIDPRACNLNYTGPKPMDWGTLHTAPTPEYMERLRALGTGYQLRVSESGVTVGVNNCIHHANATLYSPNANCIYPTTVRPRLTQSPSESWTDFCARVPGSVFQEITIPWKEFKMTPIPRFTMGKWAGVSNPERPGGIEWKAREIKFDDWGERSGVSSWLISMPVERDYLHQSFYDFVSADDYDDLRVSWSISDSAPSDASYYPLASLRVQYTLLQWVSN